MRACLRASWRVGKIPKFYASITNALASAYIRVHLCAYLCKWHPGFSKTKRILWTRPKMFNVYTRPVSKWFSESSTGLYLTLLAGHIFLKNGTNSLKSQLLPTRQTSTLRTNRMCLSVLIQQVVVLFISSQIRYQRDAFLTSYWCLYFFDLILMSRC